MDIPGTWTNTIAPSTDASPGVAPMLVDESNVWADMNDDSDGDDEVAISSSLMETSSTPESSALPNAQQPRTRDNSDTESPGPKQGPSKRRISMTTGPKHHIVDDIHNKVALSKQKAQKRGIDIQRMCVEVIRLRNEHREDIRRRTQDQDNEEQMADSILQYEREVESLKNENNQVTNTLQEALKQFNEMNNKLNDIQAEHQRESAARDNEITTLRRRLQAAEEAGSARRVTPETVPYDRVTSSPRGGRSTIGVVPLRPVASANQADEQPDSDMGPDMGTPQGIQTIQAVVKEVINQLNADIDINKGIRTRRSTRTRNRLSIEGERRKIGKAKDLAWKESVRVAWKAAFNVTSIDDLSLYDPAPADVVQEFELGRNGPNEDNILDFGKGYDRSRWNKSILERLCANLLAQRHREGRDDASEVSHEYLIALFQGQLKRLRDTWKLVQKRPNHDVSGMETVEEVSQRLEMHSRERLEAVASRSRRERKHERRTLAVQRIISIKSRSGAPDLDTWRYFESLLQKLSIDGMSSEEEGVSRIENVQVSVFRVKLCAWRNPALRDYLKYIDRESQNPSIRPSRGGKLQPRIPTNVAGITPPPKNLPECLYNVEWLEEQKSTRGEEWIDKELMVSREVFEVLEFVANMDD